MPYFVFPGEPDPSKEVAAEILRRHRNEERSERALARQPALLADPQALPPHPPNQDPPKWPLTGVRQPLGRGPRPRSGAVALKEPW